MMFNLKTVVSEPVAIHIEKNSSTLNIQQSLLFQQEQQRMTMLDRANEHLDNKAVGFLQAGTLLVTLVGAFNIPDFLTAESTVVIRVISIIAFVVFGIMILVVMSAWTPAAYFIPGRGAWEQATDGLFLNKEDCFLQILSNSIEVSNKLKDVNLKKTGRLRWSAFAFFIEVLCVTLIACLA